MATIDTAAKFLALSMNADNGLTQPQRDGYLRVSRRILMAYVEVTKVDPMVALDEIFSKARAHINEWDVSKGRSKRYSNG